MTYRSKHTTGLTPYVNILWNQSCVMYAVALLSLWLEKLFDNE